MWHLAFQLALVGLVHAKCTRWERASRREHESAAESARVIEKIRMEYVRPTCKGDVCVASGVAGRECVDG